MIRQVWASKLGRVCSIAQITGTVIAGLSGAALAAKPELFKDNVILVSALTFNQTYAFLIISISSFVAGMGGLFKKRIGSNNTWNTVSSLLEEYKKAITEGRAEYQALPHHYIRITLYKYVAIRYAFCWHPFTGWVVPIARTGRATISRHIPRFRTPEASPDNAEGVAGRVYIDGRIISVFDLPDLAASADEAALKDYAERGFVTTKWLQKRKTHTTRALLGVPIEVKNKVWGALVIDSRTPDEITTEETLQTLQYKTLASVLGKLLEN